MHYSLLSVGLHAVCQREWLAAPDLHLSAQEGRKLLLTALRALEDMLYLIKVCFFPCARVCVCVRGMQLFIDCDRTVNFNSKCFTTSVKPLFTTGGSGVGGGKKAINRQHFQAHPASPVSDLIPLAAGSSCPTNKVQSKCTLTRRHQSNGSLWLLLRWSFLGKFN